MKSLLRLGAFSAAAPMHLGNTLKSLARHGFLYRRPDGAYDSPTRAPRPKAVIESTITPPSDAMKMGGHARVARSPARGTA